MQDNQNDFAIRFVVITQEILSDKKLNAIEKIILARICSFERFFEACSTTADELGTTELVVQRTKRKLAKLGYIVEVEDTGHGKVYAPNHTKLWKSRARYDKKVTSDVTKKSHQMLQKSHTYNKEKKERESNEQSSQAMPVENSEKGQEEFGNHEINEFLSEWEKITGNKLISQKKERRAAYNLIRSQSKEGLEAILAAIKDIYASGDRYAPGIVVPSDLVGEYSKLPKLRLWCAKNKDKQKKENKTKLVLDYNGLPPVYEITEQERAEVKARIRKMRESGNLPF